MKHYTRGTHPNSLKNLSNKKYIVNDQFFETDGFEQGYYAGILAADGCIVGNNANAISWSVQRRDRVVLEQFKSALNYTGVIRDYLSHGYPQSNLTITSSRLVNSLRDKYLLTPRKSLTLEPPEILDLDTRNGFVKGLIDGDGTIGVYNGNELSMGICGTKPVVNFVLSEWERVTGESFSRAYKSGNRQLWAAKISNTKARRVFMYYSHLPLGLNRKWSQDKVDLCANWAWKSKKYTKHLLQYKYIADRLGSHELSEIAQELDCTYQNIWYIVNRSKTFEHFLNTDYTWESVQLDKAEKTGEEIME